MVAFLLSTLKGVDDDGSDVRKIQIEEKVGKDDVGEVGQPAIEIKLELPARNSASAVDDEDYEGQAEEEEEVIRIESIEVTTLDPREVEEIKVSWKIRIGTMQSKFEMKTRGLFARITQPRDTPNFAISPLQEGFFREGDSRLPVRRRRGSKPEKGGDRP